jgi:Ran GTPase-activating protein (RanGAP) involved in mRNA processing and transport
LKNSTSIRKLDLYGNKIAVEGAKILSEGLQLNSTLEFLDLGFNRIRNKGAKAIAEGILGPNSQSKL